MKTHKKEYDIDFDRVCSYHTQQQKFDKKQRYLRPSDWLVKLLVIKTNVRFMDNLEIFRSGDSGLWPLGVYFWTISMEISDLLC